MEEIICPHCSKAFKVDEAGYANIVNQIRDQEFSRDLEEKIESIYMFSILKPIAFQSRSTPKRSQAHLKR